MNEIFFICTELKCSLATSIIFMQCVRDEERIESFESVLNNQVGWFDYFLEALWLIVSLLVVLP